MDKERVEHIVVESVAYLMYLAGGLLVLCLVMLYFLLGNITWPGIMVPIPWTELQIGFWPGYLVRLFPFVLLCGWFYYLVYPVYPKETWHPPSMTWDQLKKFQEERKPPATFEELMPHPLYDTRFIKMKKVCLVCGWGPGTLVLRTTSKDVVPLCEACGKEWHMYGYSILSRLTPKQLVHNVWWWKHTHWWDTQSLWACYKDLKAFQAWAKLMKKWEKARKS